jgi:hypothetical protein
MAVSPHNCNPIEFVNLIINKVREDLKQKRRNVFINFSEIKIMNNPTADENIWMLLKYVSDTLIQKRVINITVRFNYLVPTILNKIKGTFTSKQTERSKNRQISIKMVENCKITNDFEKLQKLIQAEPQYYILNAMYIVLPEKKSPSLHNSLDLDTYDPADYPVFKDEDEPKPIRSVSMYHSSLTIPNVKHNVDGSNDDIYHTQSPPKQDGAMSSYKTSAEAWSAVQKVKQISQSLQSLQKQ